MATLTDHSSARLTINHWIQLRLFLYFVNKRLVSYLVLEIAENVHIAQRLNLSQTDGAPVSNF